MSFPHPDPPSTAREKGPSGSPDLEPMFRMINPWRDTRERVIRAMGFPPLAGDPGGPRPRQLADPTLDRLQQGLARFGRLRGGGVAVAEQQARALRPPMA
jgi:hypothetical protein